MRYFRRGWPDLPEDPSWGPSVWFFETDDLGVVARQIEVYAHGPTLRYGPGHTSDDRGMLSEKPLDLIEWDNPFFETTAEVFEEAWRSG